MISIWTVCTSCRKNNSDTNILKTLCTMDILPIFSVDNLRLLRKTNYQFQKVAIKHEVRAVKKKQFVVLISSRVINLIRYCLILSFLLLKEYINYKILKISNHSFRDFLNYFIYKSEHLNVLLGVWAIWCFSQQTYRITCRLWYYNFKSWSGSFLFKLRLLKSKE